MIIAPLVAAVLIVAGVVLDPDIEASGRELAEDYADHEGVTQLSALSFHFAFIMWAPIVFALVSLVQGRGAWLANVAAILAVLGATTLPGFLLVDNYDIAIVQELGGDGWQRVTDNLEDQPGATVMFITGLFGFATSLPVALFAAWRAGLVPLWTPIAVSAGAVAAQAVQPLGIGLLLLGAAMVALAYAFSRMDWRPREAVP